MNTITLKLELTNKEVEYLRNSTSDLGTNDKDAVSLQLKIANAILDAKSIPKKGYEDEDDYDDVLYHSIAFRMP